MPKPLEDMTRGELQRAYLKADAAHSAVTRALIDAGRGQETGNDTAAKSDPLSLRYVESNRVFFAVLQERQNRMSWHGTLHRIIRKET